MNKERLQEIKDSIDFQREFLIASNMQTLCVDEEMELYNEIIRLKKQKDDVVEYIKYQLSNFDFEKDEDVKAKMLGAMILIMLEDNRMLGEIE